MNSDAPPRRVAHALREAVRQAELAELTRMPQQGKVLACVADQPVSSHYIIPVLAVVVTT